MPILFALVGATGIGKSRLSLDLAEHYDAEIISVDSRQIYKGFAVGTAQPSREDMRRVRHHLVDFLSPSQVYSAGMFCSDVKTLLRDNPDKNYILVGGTGLYLQSLIFGLPQIPQIDASLREALECKASEGPALYEEACRIDSDAMVNVDCNNIQRIVRVLEVWKATGRKLSDWQKDRVGGIGEIHTFWLQRNRENLYARINARVDKMMDDGWLDEIHELAKNIPLDAPAWQSLGYKELLAAKGDGEVSAILENVKRKTRNYAKRQLTWFRWQLKTISVDLDSLDEPGVLIEQLIKGHL